MATHSLDLESGSSQYASIADASQTGLDITGDLSGECWIKPESLSANMVVFQKAESNALGGYSLLLLSSGKLFVRIDQSTNGTDVSEARTSKVINTGVWWHVAFTYTASTGAIKIYLNGIEQTLELNTTAATAINNNADPFLIGSVASGGNYFDGLVRRVRVFSDVRTAVEIQMGAINSSVSDANLEGEWDLNNSYSDTSGNSNTLTATGSPSFSTDIPIEIISIGNYTDGTNESTKTFSSKPLGDAAASRYIIVAFGARTVDGTGGNITAGTINGVAASIQAEQANSGNVTGFLIANVSSGSSGDIVLTFDESMTEVTIAVYYVKSLSGTTAYDTLTSTSSDPSGTIDIPDVGLVLAVARNDIGSAPPIAAWSSNLSEDLDIQDANTNNFSTAHGQSLTASAGVTISITWTGADVRPCFSAITIGIQTAQNYTQGLDETVTLVDTISKGAGKALSETITLVDTQTKAITKSLNEVATLVDTLATNIFYSEDVNEILTLNDVTIETKIVGKTLDEVIPLVDTIRRDMTRIFNETATLVDTLANQVSLNKTFNEEISLLDSISKQAGKSLNEFVELVDTISQSGAYARTLDEVAVLVDSIIKGAGKVLGEVTTLVDTLSRVGTFARTLSENVTLVEYFQGLINGINIRWIRKYATNTRVFTAKYATKTVTWIKKYLDIP